MHPSK
jgi:hypothetical protein